MPPDEATLDSVGSLTTGVAEDEGLTIDDGTPSVDATLDLTGLLSMGVAELEAGTIDEGMPPVGATTEGLDGSGAGVEVSTGLGEGEGEGVGVRTGRGIPPLEGALDTGAGVSLDAAVDDADDVGRMGFEGTGCAEPTSGVVDIGSDAELPALVMGEGETMTVSTVSEDDGRRCNIDSKMLEMSENWLFDVSGRDLGGWTRSGVECGGVAGAVVFANCRLTCRGK